MRFYQVERGSGPPEHAEYPCVILQKDNWNDFGYYTLRRLRYYKVPAEPSVVQGDVKILRDGYAQTELPVAFEKLPADYCSLGQSIDYYRQLSSQGTEIWTSILAALNDVVLYPEIANRFKSVPGFYRSLLRFSDAVNAFKTAERMFRVGSVESSSSNGGYSFTFETQVEGASSVHSLTLDFSANMTGLNRIAALVGRNGTGKTQVLARFANAMSGLSDEQGSFSPQRPDFSRVIAISYSMFDDFDRPSAEDSFSYTYCGVRSLSRRMGSLEDGDAAELGRNTFLSLEEISRKRQVALSRVQALGRGEIWRTTMKTLFGEQFDSVQGFEGDSLYTNLHSQMSSGQRILYLVMSELIAYIESGSIVLYDEPELYQHPDAQSSIARALHEILSHFKSYAIIATHSPVFLQEIPARMVRLFKRYDNMPQISELPIESFGESISSITDRIFDLTPSQQNYRHYLLSMWRIMGETGTNEAFGRPGLGMHARAYLRTLELLNSEKHGEDSRVDD
jgi:predicted ATPase